MIITPHVGGQSARRIDDMTDFFCENLRRYQTGQPLLNLVDKRLGFPVRTAARGSRMETETASGFAVAAQLEPRTKRMWKNADRHSRPHNAECLSRLAIGASPDFFASAVNKRAL